MLSEFVTANHAEIVGRARERVSRRSAPRPTDDELARGIPLFVNQLADALRTRTESAAMGAGATSHGAQLHRMNFTVAQVVHDYGDVCQSITQLAMEQDAPISAAEFQLLNKCLDDAIADAMTEYERLRESSQTLAATERLGYLAHELRNKIGPAMLAHHALKSGQVAWGGSTGAVLERNLKGIQELISRSLAEVRVESGVRHLERYNACDFVEEIEADGSLAANERAVHFTVTRVDRDVALNTDRQLLAAALMNLLTNAFKFTPPGRNVWLRTSATKELVIFDVEDECGGLQVPDAETLFAPWTQASPNKTGLGLGLPLVKRSVEAIGGTITLTNRPGTGCTFRTQLPRAAAVGVAAD